MADEAGTTPEGTSQGWWGKMKSLFTRAKESEAAEKAGEFAEKAWDKTKDVSGKAWDKTKDVAEDVKEKVEEKWEDRRTGSADSPDDADD